jgi:hypothetical protein
MKRFRIALGAIALLIGTTGFAELADSVHALPISVSAGMGANYQNPQDIVEMINGTYRPSSRVGEFIVAVDFFGSLHIPVSGSWIAKLEYAYLLTTISTSSAVFGATEFTLSMHMPTLLLQYALIATPMYNLKAGIGAGVHFGGVEVRYWGLTDSYTASGPALALDLEGETAFAEHVFIYLGADARWSAVGELKNSAGRGAGVNNQGNAAGLHQFGIGARLGFSYHF